MTDCTHGKADRRARALRALIAGAASVAIALISGHDTARADGDPASDVLVTQNLFLPQDAGVPAVQQAQLEALLREAVQRGYQVRVALVASPSDLGSVTALWHQPSIYARFLGQELSLTYRGRLLVAMPNGFGFVVGGHEPTGGQNEPTGGQNEPTGGQNEPTGGQTVLRGVPVPGSGPGLAVGALAAVRQLAEASGHPLALPKPARRGAAGVGHSIQWIVFGIGAVLIALAWTASLRAKPLRAGRRGAPAS